MPNGGKREGAGRKPRLKRYRRRESIGIRPLKIGLLCEMLWRKSYKSNFIGFHWIGEKRPRSRKRIIAFVARRCNETPSMVERLWDEFRRFRSDLREDLPPV
jgi:hypothetical protein